MLAIGDWRFCPSKTPIEGRRGFLKFKVIGWAGAGVAVVLGVLLRKSAMLSFQSFITKKLRLRKHVRRT